MKELQFGIQLPIWNPTYTPKPRQNPHGTLYHKVTQPELVTIIRIAQEAEKQRYASLWAIEDMSTLG